MIRQRHFFYQNRLYIILLITLSPLISYHFLQTNKEVSDIINHTIPILILLSISQLGLKISISKDRISFQWIWLSFFFKENVISTNSITSLKVVKYNFLDGGLGYGMRYSPKYGQIFNVYGNTGLSIKTEDKKILLGIQKEKEIREFISNTFHLANE